MGVLHTGVCIVALVIVYRDLTVLEMLVLNFHELNHLYGICGGGAEVVRTELDKLDLCDAVLLSTP